MFRDCTQRPVATRRLYKCYGGLVVCTNGSVPFGWVVFVARRVFVSITSTSHPGPRASIAGHGQAAIMCMRCTLVSQSMG